MLLRRFFFEGFIDSEIDGIMDLEAFYTIDIKCLSADDYKFLKKLKKGKVNRRTVKSMAIDPYLEERAERKMMREFYEIA